jgi:hypothetical protein
VYSSNCSYGRKIADFEDLKSFIDDLKVKDNLDKVYDLEHETYMSYLPADSPLIEDPKKMHHLMLCSLA